MNRKQAIRKILACLRLSASSNPHEAAAALRQAQKLMAQHGVDQESPELIGVQVGEVKTRFTASKLHMPVGTVYLSSVVAQVCHCRCVVASGFGHVDPRWKLQFYGLGSAPEIAAYMYTVLNRQMQKDRLAHLSRVRKAKNRAARGDSFCCGWISAIKNKLEISDISEDAAALIERAVNSGGPLKKYTPAGSGTRLSAARHQADFEAGGEAGRNAQYAQGVNGVAPRELENLK